jgi:hypothetical protein
MTTQLTDAGFAQTKAKLSDLIERRSRILDRADLSPTHRAEVVWSYDRMIRQYRREIKLYEAAHGHARTAEHGAEIAGSSGNGNGGKAPGLGATDQKQS